MKLPIKLQVDEDGRLRARATGAAKLSFQTLVDFLETDLANNRAYCLRILEESRRLASGDPSDWSCTGDAFSIALGAMLTRITPLFGKNEAQSLLLDTDDFVELVEGWLALIDEVAQED